MGLFHVNLVLSLIMRSQSSYLSYMTCFKSRAERHILDNWSKQCTLEVSVIAAELVSSMVLIPTKKLSL